jgi:two-component system nitrogen regulation sensor histidine kinase GlnL
MEMSISESAICTNQVHTEAMLHEQAKLLDALHTAVLVFDANMVLRTINAAGQGLLGLGAKKACGLSIQQLFHPPDALAGAIQRVQDSGRACSEQNVHLHIGPEQRNLVVDYTITHLQEFGADELLVEMVDVEYRDRILREESLLAQYQVNHTLIRGMAHEIKNPLGGIRGAAQLLARQLGLDSSLQEYTNVIIEETDRLDRLVTRMLGPSQLFDPASLNIHEVLEHVRRLIEADAKGQFTIHRDYDPSLPSLVADRNQLIQAFLNLLKNAAEALPTGGNITIRTRALPKTIGLVKHRLVIRVDIIDDGHGVQDEIREGIFYPMVTGHASGTGLGLPIAQSLIRHHGGFIEFESKPGITTFTTWLPVEES